MPEQPKQREQPGRSAGLDGARVAGAPISWGVCEVPGWGHQLAPRRVLAEMAALDLTATEFGPDGFLPAEPARRGELLAAHGLRAVGGFVPALLHAADHDPLPDVAARFPAFRACGAHMVVLAAVTGHDGYDGRPDLDRDDWRRLLANLDRLADAAAEHGLATSLHPHVGTVVERPDEVHRVLDGSRIGLCLDTGHLLVGGTDPVELARQAAARVTHVHLKDVDATLAVRVADGATGYGAAVAAGLYRPLGRGDVDVAGVVAALERAGYAGWYVLEQDTVLTAEPADGSGPLHDVRASLDFLSRLAV